LLTPREEAASREGVSWEEVEEERREATELEAELDAPA